MLKLGDIVVYPPHGAGRVVGHERRTILGEERDCLVIHVLQKDMTLTVPVDSIGTLGLRPIVSDEQVEQIEAVLRGEQSEVAGNWNRRFRHNRELVKSANVLEVAEVMRNLALRARDKPLSAGERQLLQTARRTLASELQFARQTTEQEALDWLDAVLEGTPTGTLAEHAPLE